MARALIVGCGCRGRELAAALVARGHAVRGTTRDPASLTAIEAAGAEAVVADPGRLATLAPQLEGVSVLCWLMGTAAGEHDEVAAIHGPRLQSMLAAIVDSPVRGVVYEAAGSVDPELLAGAMDSLRRVRDSHRIPVAAIETDPARPREWLPSAVRALDEVLEHA